MANCISVMDVRRQSPNLSLVCDCEVVPEPRRLWQQQDMHLPVFSREQELVLALVATSALCHVRTLQHFSREASLISQSAYLVVRKVVMKVGVALMEGY